MIEWRSRNLAWLNGRVRAFWAQTPHQARLLGAAGVELSRLVSDHACYGIPDGWAAGGAGEDSDGLLYAGRISPEKGLHVLLNAFTRWDGEAELRIAGLPDDADYAQHLRAMTHRDRRVIWLGPTPRSELDDHIRRTRAVLIPSQWHENHPIIAHEALALGVPVYCSDVPSMRHLQHTVGLTLVPEPAEADSWRAILPEATRGTAHPRGDGLAGARMAFEKFVDDTISVYERVTT